MQFVARATGKTFVDYFSSGAYCVDDGVIEHWLLSTVNLVRPPGLLVIGVKDQAISDVKDTAMLSVIHCAIDSCVVDVLDGAGVEK